jgi:SAM-dependent methyltransferase
MNLSLWGKILIFVCILLIIYSIYKRVAPKTEGFQQTGDFIVKEGNDIYDDFYADIYDQMVYSHKKNNYEIGQIISETMVTSESIILDVGCGTGNHVNILGLDGYNVTGIDISPAMINKAKEFYPNFKYMIGDVMQGQVFSPETFTHILCMYFSIYYFQNKDKFFKNAMKWLKPGGYLVVHVVDREQFDPILPAGNPLILVSPQKYAKDRITHTSIVFDNMEYKGNFKLDQNKNMATFEEKFTDKKTGRVRKNEHKLHMETDKEILVRAQNAGFIYHGKIDMLKCGYEYQYLFIFVKPN